MDLRKLIAVPLALTIVALQVSAATSAPWDAGKAATANELIARFLGRSKENSPPGLSVALARDGELVMAKGYGNAGPGQPADERTVYHIGSLTKQFTAAAILDLVARGGIAELTAQRMDLDSEIGVFLPGFEHWESKDAKPVTLRRLLNMTSNLPNFTRQPPAGADPWGAIEANELLREIRNLSPHGWPDTFEYSNTSYFLLAEIIESVIAPGDRERRSYRDTLRTSFQRAGMTHTGFVGDYAPGSHVATPRYRRAPAFVIKDWLKGSADIASNALDMHAWNQALMAGKILDAKRLALMFSEGGRVSPTLWYGMGAFVENKFERDVFSHSGSVPGFTSFNGIFKQAGKQRWASVTLLTNSDEVEDLDQLASDLGDLLLAE